MRADDVFLLEFLVMQAGAGAPFPALFAGELFWQGAAAGNCPSSIRLLCRLETFPTD